MTLILSFLFKSLAVFIVAKMLPGIHIKNFGTAVLVAGIYSLINLLLGKVLFFLAFPVIFITFGLFAFIINAFLLWLTDKMIEDFKIDNFGITILAAFLIMVSDKLLNWIFL
ncbi:putative membrane protein [Desulfobacula phenolica]|uniref:Putative membrane protein n=2 Tax=Desulfobacula phenolica TaxID=90732 RepID=A0A1H2JW33_9BACT|nr:putative membrane protein [Desulfobacula phenolica]